MPLAAKGKSVKQPPAERYEQYGRPDIPSADPAEDAMGRINNTIDRLIFQCRRKDRDLDAVKQVAWKLVQQLRKARPKPAAADLVGMLPEAHAGDPQG